MYRIGLATCVVLVAALSGSAFAGALDTLFDVLNDEMICTGPPYPTTAHRVALAHQTTEESELDGELSLGIKDARDAFQAHVCLDLAAGDVAPRWSGFATASRFDLLPCDGPDGTAWPERSLVTSFMQLQSDDGVPAEFVILRPELSVSDERRFFLVTSDESSFEITCRSEFESGASHELVFHGQIGDGLELGGLDMVLCREATGVRSTSGLEWEDSFFADRALAIFDVSVALRRTADVDPAQPILSLRIDGQFLGAPSPVEDSTWGAVKSIFRS